MLTLYSHPLASFCHKVLIALYENDVPFTAVMADPDDPVLRQAWPVGKFPVLHDDATGTLMPETSIIIEYLHDHFPGPVQMLPRDPDERLQVRLRDRFFDLYVSVPMQKIVTDRLRPAGGNDPHGVDEAHRMLDIAYGMAERQLDGHAWAVGDQFGMADCAALPGLFFASIVHPFDAGQGRLAAYFDRLMARPSVRRVLAEAQPWFQYFPYRESMPDRYLMSA